MIVYYTFSDVLVEWEKEDSQGVNDTSVREVCDRCERNAMERFDVRTARNSVAAPRRESSITKYS
jgi:hypothetical protein